MLQDLQFERVLAIEVENIQADPVLFHRYADRIPVLLLDERLSLDPPITKTRVVLALDQLDRERDYAAQD